MTTAQTDREIDARVAVEVMGWTKAGWREGYWYSPDDPDATFGVGYTHDGHDHEIPDFSPTTDPAADLSVLEHVRTTWDHDRRWAFARVLVEVIWRERGATRLPPAMRYEVGDYSRAALAVIDGRTW